MSKVIPQAAFILLVGGWLTNVVAEQGPDYLATQWHPIHFQPQIAQATDRQCLACHREVLEDKPRARSPAGVKASETLAWYQTLSTYRGEQESFHRRHLVTALAKQLLDLKCNTCHQGHNPREQAIIPPNQKDTSFTLRKSVNPKTCLMCHGQFPYEVMGLPGDWSSSGSTFSNNCLLCHQAIRTNRHQVNYLKPAAIEAAGAKNSDVCYGCHGGRSWYRIAFPYARNGWQGMPPEVPEWARNRPTKSEARFRARAPKSNPSESNRPGQ